MTCPIIGNRTPEQLEENLGCLDVTITVEDRQRLDAAAPPGGVLVALSQRRLGAAPVPNVKPSTGEGKWENREGTKGRRKDS